MNRTMRAWQLTARNLQSLKLQDVPMPVPGPGEVLIRVAAVSLNYRDKAIVEGNYPTPLTLPQVPASDMSGRIVALGASVAGFREGDRVNANFRTRWLDERTPYDLQLTGQDQLGGPLPGVLAEYVVLPAYALVRAPDSLSDLEAATLPIAALTAWYPLVDLGGLRAGQSVLAQGTGGVSLFGIQFARMFGARAIITSRDAGKLRRATELGATDVIDTREHPQWAKRALELTGGAGADHILDTVGGDSIGQSVEAAAIGGRITSIGFLDSAQGRFDIFPLLIKRLRIEGITVAPRSVFERMNREIDARGGLKPAIDDVYPFERAPAAFAHLDRGPFGKVVIDVKG